MPQNSINRRYLIARNGKQIFDVDTHTLIQYWKAGKIEPSDHYWTNGMSSWWEVSKLPIISNHLQQNNSANTSPTNLAVQSSTASQTNNTLVPKNYSVASQYTPPTQCPNCQSKTIRTARAIYLSGTRDSTTYGHSFSWGRRSSPRSYSSQRTSKSRLAAQLAPPETSGGCTSFFKLIIAIFGLGIISMIFVNNHLNQSQSILPFIFSLGVSGLVLYGIYRLVISDLGQTSDNETKRRQMEEYDRTWYCNKCATKFIC